MARRSPRAVGKFGAAEEQIGAIDRHVPQTQERPPPIVRPSTSMKRLVARAGRQAERLAPLLQPVESGIHRRGIRRQQPGAESQRALGRGTFSHDGGIAFEARFAIAPLPAHQKLALRPHQQGGEIVGASQAPLSRLRSARVRRAERRCSRTSRTAVVAEKATRPRKSAR